MADSLEEAAELRGLRYPGVQGTGSHAMLTQLCIQTARGLPARLQTFPPVECGQTDGPKVWWRRRRW